MYVSLTYPFNIVQYILSHIGEHRKLDSLATPDNIVWSTVMSCWTNNVRQFDPSLWYSYATIKLVSPDKIFLLRDRSVDSIEIL